MKESVERAFKKLLFHYAHGGSQQAAQKMLREYLPPNRSNLALPAKIFEAYSFAVEIKLGEQSREGAVAMMAYHGLPLEEAQEHLNLALDTLSRHYGRLHYEKHQIECPSCDWSAQIGFHYLGKEIACPACTGGFTVAV